MYPKYSKKTEGDTVIMEQRLLKKVSHLRLNTTKCKGCGICSEVCPKEAIVLGLVGAVLRGAVKGGSPISIDPSKCSYCGVCTIMCPFDALEVRVDGEPSLPIQEQDGFPQYDITAEIDENKCICCTTCRDVCPQNAIVRDVPVYEGESPDGEKRQAALDTEISFAVDTDKCTVCGICASLCPALRIERVPFNARDPKSAGEVVWDSTLCDACRICSDACPHDAIAVSRVTVPDEKKLPGTVRINPDLCITCTWCEQVCPTDAITIHKFFEGEIIFNIDVDELLSQGYLSELRYYYQPPKGWEEDKLKKNSTGSDYTDESVRMMNDRTGFEYHLTDIVRRLLNPKSGIKRNGILVFTRFVKEAQMLANNVEGCAFICGDMTKANRERILKEFEEGKIKVLANANVLVVGYDRPDLDTVVLAAPTLSLARYYQEIGRAIRPHPSKECGWVVDLVGNVKRFGEVKDLRLVDDGNGKWAVWSKDRKLTNVYL